jgi:hypothetical protein
MRKGNAKASEARVTGSDAACSVRSRFKHQAWIAVALVVMVLGLFGSVFAAHSVAGDDAEKARGRFGRLRRLSRRPCNSPSSVNRTSLSARAASLPGTQMDPMPSSSSGRTRCTPLNGIPN